MSERRFFVEGDTPVHTTDEWYLCIERAPHLEQDGHRGRLLLAADFVKQAVHHYGVRTVSDMGAGDGGLLSLIREFTECWGYDLISANVEAAQEERGVDVTLANFLTDEVEWGQLTVFTEVLEHLIDPHSVLRDCPSEVVVASSPDGETENNRYEFHTWGWDMAAYRQLFEDAGWQVVRHQSVGFQVLLAVRP